MKEHLQVKQFAECSSDNEQPVNEFLKEIGSKVVSVTPLYNTILDGIQYVVVYWQGQSEQSVCECKSEWIEHIDNFSDRMQCKMCGKSF